VTIWSAVAAAVFILSSISTYSKHRSGASIAIIAVWAVVAFLAIASIRQILRLEETRSPRKHSILYVLLGGGLALTHTLLAYLGLVPTLDFHLYLGLALWMSALFASAYATERRHNVRLYYALEGLVVRRPSH
jgi:hypothetical protein